MSCDSPTFAPKLKFIFPPLQLRTAAAAVAVFSNKDSMSNRHSSSGAEIPKAPPAEPPHENMADEMNTKQSKGIAVQSVQHVNLEHQNTRRSKGSLSKRWA